MHLEVSFQALLSMPKASDVKHTSLFVDASCLTLLASERSRAIVASERSRAIVLASVRGGTNGV